MVAYPLFPNDESIQRGMEFQDFVMLALSRHGVFIQPYSSRLYQYEHGENPQGVEIKLDARCTDTGRLSIEIAEKVNAKNHAWVNSGIYRRDNTWLYVQGNFKTLYVLPKTLLKLLHQSKRYQEHELPTIRKFYLPLAEAERYAALVLKFH